MMPIIRPFDAAAPRYDEAASIQTQMAERLAAWVEPSAPPVRALDIGCGTGLVSEAVLRRWPTAAVTALDASPAMLSEAQRKIPGLQIILGDAMQVDPVPHFDVVFSSMTLHWLPNPLAALRRWQGWLKPGGRLYVALLLQGSFREWRNLCDGARLKDGLWDMPRADFADAVALRTDQQALAVVYASAQEFLQRLKLTGTATPRLGHKPLPVPAMRRLLAAAPQPFLVTYETLYIELPSSNSI